MRMIGCDVHAAQQTIAMLDRETGETRLMEELGVTCQVGDPAKIRKVETRRQKHDRRDAMLLLDLLAEDRFPAIWMPPSELCDLRALLRHRDHWVRMRARVKNALQGLALAHGIRRGAGLWSRAGQTMLAALPLSPHAGQRRSELQALNDHLTTHIDELDQEVSAHSRERPQAGRLHDQVWARSPRSPRKSSLAIPHDLSMRRRWPVTSG
jgi:transposase